MPNIHKYTLYPAELDIGQTKELLVSQHLKDFLAELGQSQHPRPTGLKI